jgi:rubrerythrin
MSVDILVKALELEYEGLETYQTILEKLREGQVKQTVAQITAAERSHIRFLEGALKRLGGGEVKRSSFAHAGKAGALITLSEGEIDTLRYGINLEGRNIDFYEEAVSKVSEDLADQLREVLEQEKAHLENLQELYSQEVAKGG